MAPASHEDQLKFLISCIRYSNNGKVDFEEVRKECDVCSRGAAAKRYERMMKAYGIYQSTSSIRDTPIPSLKRKLSPTTTTAGAGVKKRKFDKADQFVEMNTNTDDDEDLTKIKPESSRSTAKEGKMKEEKIKEEEIKVEEEAVVVGTSSGSAASIQCPLTKIAKLGSADDALFNEFISFGASSGSAQGNATTSNQADLSSNEAHGKPESILITD